MNTGIKHGHCSYYDGPSPTYTSWRSMIRRCTDPNHTSWEYYGALGIKVHADWTGPGGFRRFLRDVGPRPSKAYTLGRLDSTKDYAPGNCRWETRRQQNKGLRDQRHDMRQVDGVARTLGGWARYLGIPYITLRKRLQNGWGDDAFRVRKYGRRSTVHGPRAEGPGVVGLGATGAGQMRASPGG